MTVLSRNCHLNYYDHMHLETPVTKLVCVNYKMSFKLLWSDATTPVTMVTVTKLVCVNIKSHLNYYDHMQLQSPLTWLTKLVCVN